AYQDAFPPSAATSATTARPAASSRPLTTTEAPSRAHASAIARPMPRVAPVTTTTRPRSLTWMPSASGADRVCGAAASSTRSSPAVAGAGCRIGARPSGLPEGDPADERLRGALDVVGVDGDGDTAR